MVMEEVGIYITNSQGRNFLNISFKRKRREACNNTSDVKFGSIYYSLAKGLKNGWIEKAETEKEGGNPERYIYKITSNGKKTYKKMLKKYMMENETLFFVDPAVMLFDELEENEKAILQAKINRIHDFFIEEIAKNRNLSKKMVRELATGEFFLGIELLEKGLIDELGDLDTVEEFLKEEYQLEKIDYVEYEIEISFFDALTGVFSDYSFRMGEGIGSSLRQKMILV